MGTPIRRILPVIGYAVLLALLVVPMYVLRDQHPWWFELPLGLVILRIGYNGVQYCLRIARSNHEENLSERAE